MAKKEMIKDYDYTISTGKNLKAEQITHKINGKLDALIISASRQCSIIVEFQEIAIILYRNVEFKNLAYIPIRMHAILPDNSMQPSGSAKIALNNRLRVRVEGSTETNVGVTLRIENANPNI